MNNERRKHLEEIEAMTDGIDRKKELFEAAQRGIGDMLMGTRGAQAFGAKTQTFESATQKNTLVIRTQDGESYYVKIQKSPWKWTGGES